MAKKHECYVCEGKEPKPFPNRCEKHDICTECGINRKDLTVAPWGTKGGFICKPCMADIEREAVIKFQATNPDKNDFLYMTEAQCPYCGHEYYPDDLYESSENETCPNCNLELEIQIEYTASYTCIKKPDLQTKEQMLNAINEINS